MAKMTSKNPTVQAVLDILDDGGKVKYISDFPEFYFMLRALDEKGEPIFHTDAEGNNKLPSYTQLSFVRVYAHKGKDGKVDANTAFSFFVVDKAVQGNDVARIVESLEKLRANPMYRLYTEDDHFRKRNPEAYRIAKENAALVGERDAMAQRVEELEKKLGFKKG
jgi:hypothetical protein